MPLLLLLTSILLLDSFSEGKHTSRYSFSRLVRDFNAFKNEIDERITKLEDYVGVEEHSSGNNSKESAEDVGDYDSGDRNLIPASRPSRPCRPICLERLQPEKPSCTFDGGRYNRG